VRDWYAFMLAFKGVLLEGLEVVFIAITFGASQRDVGLAALAAAAALGGLLLDQPLRQALALGAYLPMLLVVMLVWRLEAT
jgi:uncharacterized membrane protein